MFSSGSERLLPYGDLRRRLFFNAKNSIVMWGREVAFMPQLEMKGRSWEREREDKEEGNGQWNLSGLRVVWATQ